MYEHWSRFGCLLLITRTSASKYRNSNSVLKYGAKSGNQTLKLNIGILPLCFHSISGNCISAIDQILIVTFASGETKDKFSLNSSARGVTCLETANIIQLVLAACATVRTIQLVIKRSSRSLPKLTERNCSKSRLRRRRANKR